MAMSKKRRVIYEKSNGHCWYCGDKIKEKGWHEDHFIAIRRNNDGTCLNPQHDNEANLVPSCASCNRQKSSLDLEDFRNKIFQFVNSLNQYSNQYKFAKKYGLVEETNISVVFWFEKQGL